MRVGFGLLEKGPLIILSSFRFQLQRLGVQQIDTCTAFGTVLAKLTGFQLWKRKAEESNTLAQRCLNSMSGGQSAYAAPAPASPSITVSDPLKNGDGVAAFITYKVRSVRPGSAKEVPRRFSDFSWLQQKLQEKNKVGNRAHLGSLPGNFALCTVAPDN